MTVLDISAQLYEKQEQRLDQLYHDLREVRQAMIRFEQSVRDYYQGKLPRNQKHLEELREAWWSQAFHLLEGPRRDELAEEVSWYVGPETATGGKPNA
jgi:hypothetical protein